MVAMVPNLLNTHWLQSVTAGDQALKAQLLQLYMEDMAIKLNLLQDALRQQDWIALKSTAHSLKGSSSSIGAETIQALCFDLEQASQLQDPVRAKQGINELIHTSQSFWEIAHPFVSEMKIHQEN
jgi:HPt (histidine-containing phosphotransfer) domain-containing protein